MEKFRKILTLTLLAACMLTFDSCVKGDDGNDDGEEYVEVGDQVPAFTISDENDAVFNSSAFSAAGTKRSILVLYTTTCPHCQALTPIIDQVWKRVRDDGKDDQYIVVATARGESKASLQAYWNSEGFEMPRYADTNGGVYYKFADKWIPRIYIIDGTGKVEWKQIGESGLTYDYLMGELYRE